jgi:hypothetical protein
MYAKLLVTALLVFSLIVLSACSSGETPIHSIQNSSGNGYTEVQPVDPTTTSIPTPEASATPVLPEGVWSLPVVNSDHSGFENITPVFDGSFMGGTWVWRDQRGDIRRYLDPETKHLFARGQSDWDRVIIDIDLNLEREPAVRYWEQHRINSTERWADVVLRSITQAFGTNFLSQTGITPTNPEIPYEYSTWIIYRIISGSPSNNLQDQINSSEGNNTILSASYNQLNNQFVFTLYVNNSWIGGDSGLRQYSDFMFWHSLPDYSGQQPPMTAAVPAISIP